MVNSDKHNGSCYTYGALSIKISVRNETEDVSLNIFNMIAQIKNIKKTYIM